MSSNSIYIINDVLSGCWVSSGAVSVIIKVLVALSVLLRRAYGCAALFDYNKQTRRERYTDTHDVYGLDYDCDFNRG